MEDQVWREYNLPALEERPSPAGQLQKYSSAGRPAVSFLAESPKVDLGKVWGKMPVGYYGLVVTAVDPSGKDIAPVGTWDFFRDYPFEGPYPEACRSYRYAVHTAKDPLAWHSYWCKFPLDVEAMNRAAAVLLGTHDFSSFEKVGADNKTSICTVTHAAWTAIDETHLQFDITADRFLRNMVRAIVGTLLDVGRGKIFADDISGLLEKRDRSAAGQSVPGEPLMLRAISYPYELLKIN